MKTVLGFSTLFSLCVIMFLQDTMLVVAQKPLYTSSRWIVDEGGRRVKLACVNWPSHLETVLAEGLNKRPLEAICRKIAGLGFNCVRLTWPVALPTNVTLGSTTVHNHFKNLGLSEELKGIQAFNPDLLKFTLLQAFENVVLKLGENGIMVILDNHVSKPGWCCHRTDGNGFFGDQCFNPGLWLSGLSKMASIFNKFKNVVGMSLRNELRGPNQNVSLWRKFMVEGAEVVHKANPRALVIISGLSFDKDLSFIKETPLNISFAGKLVFEVHWYGVTFGQRWTDENANDVCGSLLKEFATDGGFLLNQGFPLFLSEFGGDQRGTNGMDNRFLNCMFGIVADLDLDWALWTLQGSYYLRQGIVDMDETYGLLEKDWNGIRNRSFIQRIQAIQPQYQGPSSISDGPAKIIFHPLTGYCFKRTFNSNRPKLGSCTNSEKWEYTKDGAIKVQGTDSCLCAIAVGLAPKLDSGCKFPGAKWEQVAASGMHISSTLDSGVRVCLDVEPSGSIITSTCRCLDQDAECEPGSQWFKIIVLQKNGV